MLKNPMKKYKKFIIVWFSRLLLLLNVFILAVVPVIVMSETITDRFKWDLLVLLPISMALVFVCVKIIRSQKATIIPKNEVTDITLSVDENERKSMWTPWNGFEKW